MAEISVSGTSDPYASTSYTVPSNDKNTITVTSYFKLLAAQLANQDMSDPMSSSEIMDQMVQMSMVQSISAMTESMQNSAAISTQTYAAGLVGKEVTMVETDSDGNVVGVKYGTVVSVNLSGDSPTLRLEGESEEYPLSYLMGMGKLDNPYAEKDETDIDSGKEETDEDESIDPTEPTEKTEPTEPTEPTEKTEPSGEE